MFRPVVGALAVGFGDGAYDAARVTAGDDVGRDVAHDHTAGCDDGIVADGHAGGDGHAAANPHVVADGDGPGIFEPLVATLHIDGVAGSIEAHVGGNEYVVADGDGGLVEHHAVEVGKEVFAYVDVVAVVAQEGRYDGEPFGRGAQNVAEQPFPLLGLRGQQAVVEFEKFVTGGKQFLQQFPVGVRCFFVIGIRREDFSVRGRGDCRRAGKFRLMRRQ